MTAGGFNLDSHRVALLAARRTLALLLAAVGLTLESPLASAEVVELSGNVTWGHRAICERSQGRKLVFAGQSKRTEATIAQGGYYHVRLEPGRYRVTLRCGGTDIKSVELVGYPTPTHQDLAF